MKEDNYYVYALKDPRDNSIFYIGKGIHQRVNQHEIEASKLNVTDKQKRINEIKDLGLEPIKTIIAQNCSEQEAFDIEDMMITFWNKEVNKLDNIQSGHKSKFTMTSEELVDVTNKFKNLVFDLPDKVIFIKCKDSFDYNDDYKTKYEKIRGWWNISKLKAKRIDYIFIIFNGIVKYVYKPKSFEWRKRKNGRNECKFDGELVEDSIYLNTSIRENKLRFSKDHQDYAQLDGTRIWGRGNCIAYNFL